MNKKLVKYWLKGNFNISEPIKGSSIISSDSACAHIITGEWMYLNDNCHIDKAYAYRQVEIKDSAIVNELNLEGKDLLKIIVKLIGLMLVRSLEYMAM